MASFGNWLRHWFTPHHTNNYRAHLLSNASLVLMVFLVVGANLALTLIERSPLHILGYSSSITVDEVVQATNRERLAAGLPPLAYSEQLADAARRKADNMLTENYWSHNSPSGKSPWVWFNQAGYKYTYAGENLAKDFGDTDRMVRAWMNSPTHRGNIVSDKYREIGIAVVPGKLLGAETVLVVQMFGAKSGLGGSIAPTIAEVRGEKTVSAPALEPPLATPAPTPAPASVRAPNLSQTTFLLSEMTVKKALGIGLGIFFVLALILDLVIAENRQLSRRVGKNWAHLIFINIVLLLTTIAHAGSIL